MKKKIITLLAVFAATAFGLKAQEASTDTPVMERTSSYSVTADFQYASKYVFRGLKRSNDSAQASVEFASQGFYAGLWGSTPLKGGEDEVDLYGGYLFSLNETWKLDVGGTLYFYPNRKTGLGKQDRMTPEGYVGIVGNLHGFTTALYAFHDFEVGDSTLQASLGYSFVLTPQASLDVTGTLGHISRDTGPDYVYYGVGVAVPYKLSERLTVAGSLQYASHDLDTAQKDHVWVTTSIAYAF